MSNAKAIKKLVAEATPSPGNLPPEERKSKEQLDAAKQELQKLLKKTRSMRFWLWQKMAFQD